MNENQNPDEQRTQLENMAEQFEAEEKAEAIEGEHIPAGDNSPPGRNSEKPAGADFDIVPLLAGLLGLVCEFIARRRGPHWVISDSESKQLAESTNEVIEYYMPDMQMGPLGGLLIVSGTIFGPRILMDRMAAAQPEPAAKQEEEDNAGEK